METLNNKENIKDMIPQVRYQLEKYKSENDVLLIFPDDLVCVVENIEPDEEEISKYILSLIGVSKEDSDLIEVYFRPYELFNLTVNLQRLVKTFPLG